MDLLGNCDVALSLGEAITMAVRFVPLVTLFMVFLRLLDLLVLLM